MCYEDGLGSMHTHIQYMLHKGKEESLHRERHISVAPQNAMGAHSHLHLLGVVIVAMLTSDG